MDKDRDEQIATALANLEKTCTARKITAKEGKEQRALARKERIAQIETKRKKLEEKEKSQARLKRRQYRKESKLIRGNGDTMEFTEGLDDSFISSSKNGTVERRQQRRRKGSDFFDPRKKGNDETGNDTTPTHPRQLISSFLSQSSGQRVRWADGDVGDTDGYSGFSDGTIEGELKPLPKEKNPSDSLDHVHKRKTKPKGFVKTDGLSTKTSRIAKAKEEKSHISEYNIDSPETKNPPNEDPRRLRRGQRSRSDSKSLRNKNINGGRSTTQYLKGNEVSSTDSTSLKATGLVSASKKRNIDCGVFAESDLTGVSGRRNRSSRTVRRGNLSGLSLSSKDSDDTSRGRKHSSKNTYIESRDCIRRKINQEDTNISSSKDGETVRKRHSTTRDIKKFESCIVLSEDKGDAKRTCNISHKRKEIENRCGANVDRANHSAPLRGIIGKTKSETSGGNRNREKGKEARKERRYPSTRVDRDTFSSQLAENSGIILGKHPSEVSDSHGNDCYNFKSSSPETSMKRGTLKEPCSKNHMRNINGKYRSPSRRRGAKKSKDVARETSKCGIYEIPSLQGVIDESREKANGKPSQSTQSNTKDISGKAVGKSGSKIRKKAGESAKKTDGKTRKKSSGVGVDKRLSRKIREPLSSGVRENISVRGEGTKSRRSLNTKNSSSSHGNGTKRNIKGDSVSVSSSKTSVTCRRRKKRNTGLSQRSTATNVRDESCDFNF